MVEVKIALLEIDIAHPNPPLPAPHKSIKEQK